MNCPGIDTSDRRKVVYQPSDPLLTARECAAECGLAISSFWRAVRAGHVPPAIYVTPRCPRWRRGEIVAFFEARRVAAARGAK